MPWEVTAECACELRPPKGGRPQSTPLTQIGVSVMEIILDSQIVEKLSSNGVLAYIAVKMAEGSEATTPALAGLVRCKTGNMLDGLKDLAVVSPELVAKAPNNKWRCGVVKAGDGVLQSIESYTERRKDFIDDLKKYWDWANPTVSFIMNGADGQAVNKFLREHKDWDQEMWRKALRNRCNSDVNHAQSLFAWVSRLAEYSASALDRYGKPMVNGGGKRGETITVREQNREAIARAVANA